MVTLEVTEELVDEATRLAPRSDLRSGLGIADGDGSRRNVGRSGHREPISSEGGARKWDCDVDQCEVGEARFDWRHSHPSVCRDVETVGKVLYHEENDLRGEGAERGFVLYLQRRREKQQRRQYQVDVEPDQGR
jgi:hypothetical protein